MRFDSDHSIVMNSRIGGAWGAEERQPNVFKPGMPFDLKIRATNENMEVYCANSSMHQFKHRLPFGQVKFIECDGEATLKRLFTNGRRHGR
ncbi:galactoside-binding lectin [Cooperia oncophora]